VRDTLENMEYEGSIDLVTRKMKVFIADFHVLALDKRIW
jgi:hypothetical protein